MSTILIALDFSEVTEAVLAAGKKLAQNGQDALYLIHVEAPEPDFVGYEPGPQHVRDNVAHSIQHHRDQCLALRETLCEDGHDAHALIIQGVTHEKILEEAKRLNADYIVIGRHGHGALYHMLVGSVGEAVLKGAQVPVLMVPKAAGPA